MEPATIKTFPFASIVAVCEKRAGDMSPAGENARVAGSNSSIAVMGTRFAARPPAISTLPFLSRVAV
jgi:hypothetical protein